MVFQPDCGKLITCTPEEHDRMMIVVQAVRYFSTFSLGVFLAEEGIDIARSLDFATPLYRSVINSVSRLFAQDDFLSLELMLASADRWDAIQRLVNTCDRLSKFLNRIAFIACSA
ncbi:MAG: prephenate dehydrogenase dimerization domain-containing protein [Leptodesmis sp.]|uniref:prephenate dehydrogenase dimerization domain-containing protein n=1 Tax=Leptodesmis sp. TaxID=3100501 RepID=UPI003D0E3F02